MARFFFHLRDGTDVLLDPEGRELAGVDAIPPLALEEARSIVSGDALSGTIMLNQRIDVEDETGQLIHSLSFEDAVTIVRAHQD